MPETYLFSMHLDLCCDDPGLRPRCQEPHSVPSLTSLSAGPPHWGVLFSLSPPPEVSPLLSLVPRLMPRILVMCLRRTLVSPFKVRSGWWPGEAFACQRLWLTIVLDKLQDNGREGRAMAQLGFFAQ